MDVMELENLVRNIDLRLSRIEQILPTLATKDDLKGFPTQDDPKGFATKDDLKRFATKDDLKNFATKDDLKAFATKQELLEESRKTRQQFNAVAERIESYVRLVAEGHVGLEQRLEDANRRFEQEMARIDRRVLRLEAR